MSNNYETVDSRIEFCGDIITLFYDKVLMPDGKIHPREYVSHPGAVGIVPVNEHRQVLLVKQYRHPTRSELWEIPAGKLDADESPEACALRELFEETGLTGSISSFGKFYTTPGYSDEIFYLFKAHDLSGDMALPDDDEIIEIKFIDIDSAVKMIKNHEIIDAKTICGLCLAILDV